MIAHTTPFETLRFRYPWRPYQARVLDAVHAHLDDKRLHIVAAPGAGKTTLGLEIFRILGKPTLALSPTRIIRDQWINRLKDFCDNSDPMRLEWVSNSNREPALFTSITYQALHAQFHEELTQDDEELEVLESDDSLDEDELNSFITLIERNNIGVLILDEAHHLRSEWWKALSKVCAHFPDMVLVSLTATPPYDSQGNEWMRYEQLCGPIDEEISVPELVKAKTLCAHQDFVWACDASADEKKQIKDHDDRVSSFLQSLFKSDEFESLVLSHPWLESTRIEAEIIKQPEIAIAILSFLRAKALPKNISLMAILDLKGSDIPELGRHWWQVLVETILFSSTTSHDETQQQFVRDLKKQLKASELLIKRELCIVRSRRTERYLSLSTSKIEACAKLHRLEHEQREDALRQVFLTDYIRDEALYSEIYSGKLNLGAWPVFRKVTMHSPIHEEVALLTGRLSILHVSKLDALYDVADQTRLKTNSIPGTEQYIQIIGPTNLLTNAFTALLASGRIKTLVGTRSLLGEGWDAPQVNSLVLASSVGSFMLTNQMRGRAIRMDGKAPDKISSIWHLAAINSDSYSGWADLHNLRKRFDIFVGLSEKDLTIESGFERLSSSALNPKMNLNTQGLSLMSQNNREMSLRLKKLARIKERWEKALILDHSARVIPSVRVDKKPRLRSLLLTYSFSYLLFQLGIALLFAFLVYTNMSVQIESQHSFLLLSVLLGGALLYKLPKTWAMIRTVFRHLPVDGSLTRIGYALTEALFRTGHIETSIKNTKVNVTESLEGKFLISLKGSTFYESSLFSDCLAEILAPIENPRYIVSREGQFLGSDRNDYHAVPMKLAAKKEFAQIFLRAWCKHVSLSELIYTRTPEGRKRLLKAKMKSFSSSFSNEIKRQDRWQ